MSKQDTIAPRPLTAQEMQQASGGEARICGANPTLCSFATGMQQDSAGIQVPITLKHNL